jgi:membrane dipeptidase
MFPLIVDAHLDLAYNNVNYKRDYRRGAIATRSLEAGGIAEQANGQCTVGFPDMMRGRVALAFGTIFVEPAMSGMAASDGKTMTYRDAKEAHMQGMAQLDYYYRLAEQDQRIRLVTTRKDLDEVLALWTKPGRKQIGIVPLMEGADPIKEPKELERWVERGVRIVGLAWSETRYSGGTRAPGGLTKIGYELLDMMAEYGVILDLSHMAEKAVFEALEHFEGKHVIASHSNPQKITPTDRHLPDRAIEMLAQRGGVMGVVLFNAFLKYDWTRGKKNEVTLDHVVRCVDHICQLTGSADHVGIGSDFDGGFGYVGIPNEINTIRDLHKVGDELLRRGYAQAHVEHIMGGNWVRVLRGALK